MQASREISVLFFFSFFCVLMEIKTSKYLLIRLDSRFGRAGLKRHLPCQEDHFCLYRFLSFKSLRIQPPFLSGEMEYVFRFLEQERPAITWEEPHLWL